MDDPGKSAIEEVLDIHTKNPSDISDIKAPRELKVKLEAPTYEEGFSLTSLIDTIISHLRLIFLMFIIFAAASVGAAFLHLDMTRTHTGLASAIFMFSFPEAEEGLDPLGNPINVNGIRSPYVIGRALDSLGLRERGVSAESVRAGMVVNAVIPHDVLLRSLIFREHANNLTDRLREIEEEVFHPTQYIVRIYRNGGLSYLTDQEMVDLLNEIIYQYIAYFAHTYSEFSFLDIVVGHFDPNEYDYFEIVTILQASVNYMIFYSSPLQERAPEFRSPRTQMTFGDIAANLTLLRNVDIHRIAALVHSNNMSRDRARSANILEYQIIRMEMELAAAQANADDALFLAYEIYEHVQWVLPYMEHYFIYHRETDVYEYFLRQTLNYRRESNQLMVDIEFYRNRMEALRSFPYPANPQDIQFVEESIPILFEVLQNWENIINQTAEDFLTLELYQDAVRVLTPAGFANSLRAYRQQMALIVMVGSGFGVFLGVLIALYRGERRPKYTPKHGAR